MRLHQEQAPQGYLRASSGKLAYTVPEAQDATGLSRSTLYRLIDGKKLRIIKVGTRTLIPADSLVTYLDSLEMEAA